MTCSFNCGRSSSHRQLAKPLAVDAPAIIEQITRDEDRHALSGTVSRLPDDMRTVVALRLEAGMPFAAIGEQLGRSEEVARKLFARALERLRGLVPVSDH